MEYNALLYQGARMYYGLYGLTEDETLEVPGGWGQEEVPGTGACVTTTLSLPVFCNRQPSEKQQVVVRK